jgi:dipeptidyl aminopeptidase/acylaminoacyl peptidase
MAMRYSKTGLSVIVVAAALAISACGGGGGGGSDPNAGTPAGGPPASNAARSGQMAYFFNNTIYGVDMATGVSRQLARTLNVKPAYVAHSLSPAGGLAVAYYSDGFASPRAPYSRIELYKPDGSLDTAFEFDFKIISAPSISPDGQTIAFASETRSGLLNDPPVYRTNFSDRNGVLQINSLNHASPVDWLPDGRVVLKFIDATGGSLGLALVKLPLTASTVGKILDTTKDANAFSVSPDGSQIAFSAKANSVAPSHIYVVNIDDTNRRQVTNSRDQGENQVRFSPNGKELLIGTGLCSFPFFSGQYIQVVPTDGNMVDVTDGPSIYKLKINGTQECTDRAMSWR